MPAPTSPEKVRSFERALERGCTMAEAAREAGVGYSWAKKYSKGIRNPSSNATAARYDLRRKLTKAEGVGRPLLRTEMCDEALQALEDFPYFRRRYMGRATPPWQLEVAGQVEAALRSPDREYIVENVAPGFGKSLLLTDLGAWATARDRSLRGLFGSAVMTNARRQCHQLRRTLERTSLVLASESDMRMGAVDAVGVLAADYGLFRPIGRQDIWRTEEFVVVQANQEAIESKEPTWSAVGMDSEFLGNRFNLMFWDDLATDATIRTTESIEKQRDWWDGTAETRLEPGGALFLVGQRMGADDLYRYCLDKILPDDEEEDDPDLDTAPRMYTHILWPAHDQTKCQGEHGLDAPPQPVGCMLDPTRFTRKDMRKAESKPRTWQIQYQQENANPIEATVQRIWVDGGVDHNGERYPGCWDTHRPIGYLDPAVKGRKISFLTTDPGTAKFWAIQWWVYTPDAGNFLWLMDTFKGRAAASDILGKDPITDKPYGIAVDWITRAKDAGYPITHWVFEHNNAQRWFQQEPYRDLWCRSNNVRIIEQMTTGVNKLDKDLGVDSIKDWFRFGRIRLPAMGNAKPVSMKLVDEVLRHPNAGTDDQVMACWFAVYNLPRLGRRNDQAHYSRVTPAVRDLPRVPFLKAVG